MLQRRRHILVVTVLRLIRIKLMAKRLKDMHPSFGLFLSLSKLILSGYLLVSNLSAQEQLVKGGKASVHVHSLKSPFQAHPTTLRVLLPDDLDTSNAYRTLFVLPVHEDGLFKHGDGLSEMRQLNVHNRYQVICVAPSFTAKPWYADHDKDPAKRDESHLLRTVIPFVESHYPVQKKGEGRFLIGFSKSGWGAMSLLLRHPYMFHKVVAWDPGVRIDTGPFEEGYDLKGSIRERFGSETNFESYRLSTLLRTRGKDLGEDPRLFYFNCDGVKRTAGGAKLHALMVQESIPHRYVMEPRRAHRWDSGWLPEAITFLFGDSK